MLTLTYPHRTWAHALPAGLKLAALAGATPLLLATQNAAALAGAALVCAALNASAGRGFARAALRSLWMLWPFVLVVALWHLWAMDPSGLPIILRMITAVALANFVTMTTRLSSMIAVLESLLRPAAAWVPAPRAALAIALTIRLIPVMLLRAAQLAEAWRARSPRPARWRILPALTLSALDDADRLAEALRARGGID